MCSRHESSKSVSKNSDDDEDNDFDLDDDDEAKFLFKRQEQVGGDSSSMNISRVLWEGCQLPQHNGIPETLCTRRKVSA